MAKRMKEKNERNKGKIVLNIIIVLIFLAIVSGVFYFSPNYIKEDYEGKTKILINNNNVTLKMKNDVYIDENNNVLSHTLGYNIEKYIYAVENSSNEQINKASDVCLALLGYARSVKNYCENLNS